MRSFRNFVTEGTALTPAELVKPNGMTGEARTDILRKLIQTHQELELKTGKTVIVTDISGAMAAIDQFEKDNKPFDLITSDGIVKSSNLKKSTPFGGGSGGAGSGTADTAINESAQCVWLQAMFDNGSDNPIDFYTDDILKAAAKKVDIGKTTIDQVLGISDQWIKSSWLSGKYLIENGFVTKDMKCHRDSSLMKGIYAAKNKAAKNSGLGRISDDKWNPGDIWVAKKDFSLSELPTDSIEALNKALMQLYLDRRLVGISLKLIKKKVKHKEYNIKIPSDTNDKKFLRVNTSSGRGTFWSSKGGTIDFDGGTLIIAANSYLGTHKAELKGKTARGGGIGWGVIQGYAKKTLNRKLMDNKGGIVKLAKKIDKGEKRAIEYMWALVSSLAPEVTRQEFDIELANKDLGWIHAKLGLLVLGHAINSVGGKKANRMITQMVNYAGSDLEESSSYVKVYE